MIRHLSTAYKADEQIEVKHVINKDRVTSEYKIGDERFKKNDPQRTVVIDDQKKGTESVIEKFTIGDSEQSEPKKAIDVCRDDCLLLRLC